MAVLFLVSFTTSNPLIGHGLSFWIHAIALCSSNLDAKTKKETVNLYAAVKTPNQNFRINPFQNFTNSIPLKTINFTTDRPIYLNLWLEVPILL